MRLIELDRYLMDRALVAWLGPPYYRAAIAFVEAPEDFVVVSEGASVEQTVKSLLAGADLRQRQLGERWALRQNPVMTLGSIDRWLDEYGLFLNLRPDTGAEVRYAAWAENVDGLVTHPVAGRSITQALTELVVATPRLVEPLESVSMLGREEPVAEEGELGPLELEAMLEQHGSVKATAKALGVPRSTLRGWLERRGTAPEPEPRPDVSREDIEAALAAHGSVSAAARALGVPRGTLRGWMERQSIHAPRRRALPERTVFHDEGAFDIERRRD